MMCFEGKEWRIKELCEYKYYFRNKQFIWCTVGILQLSLETPEVASQFICVSTDIICFAVV
jgi:hypothetical protein